MTKKIFIILFFLLLCYCNKSFSQVNVEWFRNYDAGFAPTLLNDFTIDSSGNSYLVGDVSRHPSSSVSAFGTVKYNSNGDLQWVNLYQGSRLNLDYAEAVVVDKAGNVYVTGTSQDIDSSENYCTIKFRPDGAIKWIRKFQAAQGARDYGKEICMDSDGYVYVTGVTHVSNSYFINTIKYDSSGNLLWASRFDEYLSDLKGAHSLIVDNFKNVYVAGKLANNFCTIKYNSNGQQQWVSYFDDSNLNNVPTEIKSDQQGNVYVLGKGFLNGSFNEYYTSLVKYDNNGNQIWIFKTDSIGISGNYYRIKMSFRIDSVGNIYFATGYRNSCSLIKLDSNGNLLWNAKYSDQPTYLNVQGNAVEIDNDGYIYVTGTATKSQSEDFCTLKYNSNGMLFWVKYFHSYDGDESAFIRINKANDIYVAGIAHGEFVDTRFSVVKYSKSVGINNISSEIPDNFNLYQNYPNPFNPKTIITYEIQVNGLVTLKIYDILGNEINTIVNENQNAGKYEADFDGYDLSSGVYYYKLSAGNFSLTKRMVLLK